MTSINLSCCFVFVFFAVVLPSGYSGLGSLTLGVVADSSDSACFGQHFDLSSPAVQFV